MLAGAQTWESRGEHALVLRLWVCACLQRMGHIDPPQEQHKVHNSGESHLQHRHRVLCLTMQLKRSGTCNTTQASQPLRVQAGSWGRHAPP